MSHNTVVRSVRITNVDALRRAIGHLNTQGLPVALLENATARMFSSYKNINNCALVVDLSECRSPYDVGLTQQEDKEIGVFYQPVLDTWDGQVARILGCEMRSGMSVEEAAIGKLSFEYSRQAMLMEAEERGMIVESEEVDKEGNLQLVFAA